MLFKSNINSFFLACCLIFFWKTSTALQLDIDITGISYHIRCNKSLQAHTKAPRKLDPYGAFVFNPGIGLGIDFRKHSRDPYWKGFSPVIKTVYVRDCDNRAMYFLNVGTRYRDMLTNSFSLDLNLAMCLVNAEKWRTNERKFAINPYASFGINYHFESNNANIGTVMSFIPKNKRSGSPDTNSFNILFVNFYVAFPIG